MTRLKILMYVVLMYLCGMYTSSAQDTIPCPTRTLTTHPDSTGGFDWRTPGLHDSHDVWVKMNGRNTLMVSYTNVYNDPHNVNIGYLATPTKDYSPEDGWEVLYHRLGTPPPQQNNLQHPVVILYNRYHALMRIFILITDRKYDYNGAKVYLKWFKEDGSDNKVAATLSYSPSPMDALDNFAKQQSEPNLVKTNGWSNEDYYWLMGEFSILYDPCVCRFQTTLETGAILINESTSGLTLRQDTVSVNPFYTPGSDRAHADPSQIPVFDNPLGIFNLLETPKVEYIDYVCGVPVHVDHLRGYQLHMPWLRQYKLMHDLSYVINPSSGLELVDIQAKLQVKLNGEGLVDTSHHPNPPGNNKLYGPYGPVILGADQDLSVPYNERLMHMGVVVDEREANYDINYYTYGTQWRPLGCLTNTSFLAWKHNEVPYANNPEVYCKVRLKLRKVNDPTAKEIVLTRTYKVDVSASAEHNLSGNVYYPADMQGAPLPFLNWYSRYQFHYQVNSISSVTSPGKPAWPIWPQQHPETLAFQNQHVPAGDYYATQTIFIGPNVTFDAGVHLRAGKEINIDPEAVVDPKVIMDIDPLYEPTCDRPVNQASAAQVAYFCDQSNNLYKPEFTAAKYNAGSGSDEPEAPQWSIQPNPTSVQTQITLTLEQEQEISLLLQDLTGKTIDVLLKKRTMTPGRSSIAFDTGRLAPGVYLVSMQTRNYREARKLVIVR